MPINKKSLELRLNKLQRQLKKAQKAEAAARARWTREHQRFVQASVQVVQLKRKGTKKEERLKGIILAWPEKSVQLTKHRDQARALIEDLQRQINESAFNLKVLLERQRAEQAEIDEIVKQTFMLNNAVVIALENRNTYLTFHVFKYLYREDGSVSTQVTLTNSDGTRRVVAMVNTINRILPQAADEAMQLFAQFKKRFNIDPDPDTLPPGVALMLEMSKKIFFEKKTIKPGEALSQFLSLPIDAKQFPELVKAQEVIKQGLRSEKTSSYVRLYVKNQSTGQWEQVKQN